MPSAFPATLKALFRLPMWSVGTSLSYSIKSGLWNTNTAVLSTKSVSTHNLQDNNNKMSSASSLHSGLNCLRASVNRQ
ncbi:hypothetical protein DPMN_097314 [Dreissena polymorpha]|uniref:Uncharacterized protein n=1 Tax=Dreissena polymorpha TaxID=45954 RepID=A0A9D4LA29_DREPO|nr:hypothetical protein DPMN_097314 [Dreissena polymorpha]